MLAGMSRVRDSWMNTGIITTTTGVLDTTAEASTTKPINRAMAIRGLTVACFWASAVNASSPPVRTSAPMMMNMAAMVQGAGLASTGKAAS